MHFCPGCGVCFPVGGLHRCPGYEFAPATSPEIRRDAAQDAEIARLTAEVERLTRDNDGMVKAHAVMLSGSLTLTRERDADRALCDRLAEALRDCRRELNCHTRNDMGYTQSAELDAVEAADAALAAYDRSKEGTNG
jgi:hypothetical protein